MLHVQKYKAFLVNQWYNYYKLTAIQLVFKEYSHCPCTCYSLFR